MALYHNSQKKQPDKLVSAKALAKRFVERNGFIRHDLCRWDDHGWCKRLPHGGKERVYLPDNKGMNPSYVENALCRAKALFHDLPCCPNLLRIDHYPEEADRITLQTLAQVGLPVPNESIQEKRIDKNTCFLQEHLYWDLTKGNYQIDKLLLEIIKGDIGGFSFLCSNVYLLNTESAVLYHLYDDRGADIAAFDKHVLLPLYKKYNNWILQHDKVKIDRLFADCM